MIGTSHQLLNPNDHNPCPQVQDHVHIRVESQIAVHHTVAHKDRYEHYAQGHKCLVLDERREVFEGKPEYEQVLEESEQNEKPLNT